MKRFKNNICMLFSFILLISLFSGCTNSKETGAKSEKQELTIAYGLDTDAKSVKGTGDMLLKIFSTDRLVELVDKEIRPSLAESWEIKNNGKTIVFKLKKDVKFSDGTPFNAEAVKFTYDRLFKYNINQWTEIDRMEKVEVIDPYTVAFHFKEGKEGFIALTSFAEYQCSILSPSSVEAKGNPAAPITNFTGTGPWKISDYKKDQYTEFVPNQYYYGKKPVLTKIKVKDVPNAESRVLAIQSGDVDVVVDYYHGGSAYTPRNMLKSLKDKGFQVMKKEYPMTIVLSCNYKKEPWNNLKVRQGLNYAVNKDEITALFDGWINPAKERMFSDSAPYMKESGEKEYGFNVEEAKKLFKEAGLTDNVKPNLIVQGQNPDEVKMCELIKEQLSKSGMDIKMDVLEPGVYSDRQKKGKWDLRIYYIGGPERRKYTRIDGRFNPDSAEFGGYGYFASPEMTPVLKKAVGSFNEEERQKNFKEFYNMVKDQAAGVPLYYEGVFVVAKPNVKNIEYFSSEPRFDNVFIDKK